MTGLVAGDAPEAETVGARLAEVRVRIESAGGDPTRVRVVAVTKGFGLDAARGALAAGIANLGENYAGELVDKATALAAATVGGTGGSEPVWHFLGGIQRNKLARLAPHVGLYQSVDRLEEGETIARRAPGASVLVEIAPSVAARAVEGRGGVNAAEADALATVLARLGLSVRGLMTVAPRGDAEAAKRAFACVAALVRRLGLEEASMGMSDDLELAVAEGATMVRIGRALFGA